MSSTIQEPPHRHAYSVDDYYRMAETGILRSGDRVELIEGEIIDMAPIGSQHAAAVKRIARTFHQAVGNHAVISVQDPIRLDRYSEPQPDIALLRLRDDFYADVHPMPADVFLVVEVAASTLDYDRNTKLPLYAQHGIPEVWLVDLGNRQFSIYRTPLAGSFASTQVLASLQHIRVSGLEDIEIDLSDLW